eukprot:scaffold504_cov189-Ochromonas_danica.AAC.50
MSREEDLSGTGGSSSGSSSGNGNSSGNGSNSSGNSSGNSSESSCWMVYTTSCHHLITFCFTSTSLADRLPLLLQKTCYSPLLTLGGMTILYLFFLLLFYPLYLLSYLITITGSSLVFFILFHLLAVYITQSIAFPGSTTSAQKQIAHDVIGHVMKFIERLAITSNEISSHLLLIFTGKLPWIALDSIHEDIYTLHRSVQGLKSMIEGLRVACEELRRERLLSTQEQSHLNQLVKAMEDYQHDFLELTKALGFVGSSSSSSSNSNNSFDGNRSVATTSTATGTTLTGSTASHSQEVLASLAGKSLSASETLRVCISLVYSKNKNNNKEEEGEWMVTSLLKMMNPCGQKLIGHEQIAFPFLRALLVYNYGARIIHIKGCSDNGIDCLYVNAQEVLRRRRVVVGGGGGSSREDNDATTTTSTTTSSIPYQPSEKLVLFCGPNAGFLENFAQMDWNTSWCGYYLSQGIDFFAFNYRGYGRSVGSPNPSLLKQDVEKVFDYVMKEFHPRHVLVHGESIGGMIACHLACHRPIHALICDRTFGSLDAAARRILAQWAGSAVKYAAWWKTDVVTDYLSATCAKVMFQDPYDEIIAHPASLKVGVAARFVLDDYILKIPQEPSCYILGRYQRLVTIPREAESVEWLSQASTPYHTLPRQFVEHFYACCAMLALKYEEHKSTVTSTTGMGGMSDKSRSSIHRSHSMNSSDRITSTHSSSINSTDSTLLSPAGGGGTEDIVAETNIRHLAAKLQQRGNNNESINSLVGNYAQPMQNAKIVQSSRLFQLNMQDMSALSKMSLSSYARVWLALGRIIGSSGQLLNHALCRGLDETAAWIVGYIVWSRNVLDEENLEDDEDTLVQSPGTVECAIADLKTLITRDGLSLDPALIFLLEALHCLKARRQYITTMRKQDHHSSDKSTVSSAGGYGTNSLCQTTTPAPELSSQALGDLISLSCGHNGWPEENELSQFTSWLAINTKMLT